MHGGSVMADETWTAAASPHILPFDMSIYAKVTLEPCAVVRIAPRATVTVRVTGSLLGAGTPSNRILIGARDDGKPFSSLRNLGGTIELSYTTLEGGGDPLNTQPYLAGMLAGSGQDPKSTALADFTLKNVEIRGSKTNGILLTGEGHFSDDSADVTVTGSGQYPVSVFPRRLGSVPSGTYTGNAHDEILLPGSGVTQSIVTDQTMHDRGVPYHVGNPQDSGELAIGSQAPNPVAALTIEPGVVVRFQKGGYLQIENFLGDTMPASGALIARGTADKPIKFTSAEAAPAVGDWVGLTLGGKPDPRTVADHIVVEYAGLKTTGGTLSCEPGQRQHAIHLRGQPASAFITNSTIAHSTAGFNSGWRGSPVDFSATNTFTDVPGCKLTNPPDANNNCTGRPTCAVP